MTLPKLEAPTFLLTIPSTKKEVKFRPFLVKEEKILLIAMADGNEDVIFNAINDIIENCLFKQVKAETLTTYDLEYIFLQIRIKSKGADVDLLFQCENEIPNPKDKTKMIMCGHANDVVYDLNDVIITDTNHDNKIMLDKDKAIGIIMKPPTLKASKKLHKALAVNDIEAIYDSLPDYVDTIFQGEKTFDDYTVEEFRGFIDSLNDEQFGKIQDYFKNIPKLKGEINITCEACGHNEKVTLEGLSSFLA